MEMEMELKVKSNQSSLKSNVVLFRSLYIQIV